jgi:hypothetical protein
MKKFKVIATYATYVYAYVEADTEDDAHQIALDMDGGSFDLMDDDLSDWHIADVIEVDE